MMMYQTLTQHANAREVLNGQFELLSAVHALQPEHARVLCLIAADCKVLPDWMQISTAKVQHGNSIHLMTRHNHY